MINILCFINSFYLPNPNCRLIYFLMSWPYHNIYVPILVACMLLHLSRLTKTSFYVLQLFFLRASYVPVGFCVFRLSAICVKFWFRDYPFSGHFHENRSIMIYPLLIDVAKNSSDITCLNNQTVQWIYHVFHQCVNDVKEEIGFTLGLISICCWICASVP